jgi:hypothetical protein
MSTCGGPPVNTYPTSNNSDGSKNAKLLRKATAGRSGGVDSAPSSPLVAFLTFVKIEDGALGAGCGVGVSGFPSFLSSAIG